MVDDAPGPQARPPPTDGVHLSPSELTSLHERELPVDRKSVVVVAEATGMIVNPKGSGRVQARAVKVWKAPACYLRDRCGNSDQARVATGARQGSKKMASRGGQTLARAGSKAAVS